jgi:hypothetical protein
MDGTNNFSLHINKLKPNDSSTGCGLLLLLLHGRQLLTSNYLYIHMCPLSFSISFDLNFLNFTRFIKSFQACFNPVHCIYFKCASQLNVLTVEEPFLTSVFHKLWFSSLVPVSSE